MDRDPDRERRDALDLQPGLNRAESMAFLRAQRLAALLAFQTHGLSVVGGMPTGHQATRSAPKHHQLATKHHKLVGANSAWVLRSST
ncbi:hypothetical protein GCM10008955_16210 [Deinococcus malanensis]|uniref:Uncharacterized protein n=1 Tax=Deinococcus malanensis TaxID=1706855 RepID=A0ABQ2EW00_9DEIO|nr:hypothetical protein GCM10008955_16210 [Deinococcus malanensis]